MKTFEGKVLFLDRNDINTDEIIPAKYLTEIEKTALAPYLLEDLKLEGFDPRTDIAGKSVVVSRTNFGCGSSREHAPWALDVNGIHIVVAAGFARIYRQNMFNCGLLAAELPEAEIDVLFREFAGKDTEVRADLDAKTLAFRSTDGKARTSAFTLAPFDEALVRAGGWLEYADTRY